MDELQLKVRVMNKCLKKVARRGPNVAFALTGDTVSRHVPTFRFPPPPPLLCSLHSDTNETNREQSGGGEKRAHISNLQSHIIRRQSASFLPPRHTCGCACEVGRVHYSVALHLVDPRFVAITVESSS